MELIWTIVSLIVAAVVGILISAIVYARWNYGYLESLGIPVVKPFLFFGSNYTEHWVNIKALDIQRREKYGTIYGVYDGRRPQIYVSDPKLIRLITTVDFDHFRNHGWYIGDSNGVMTQILDVLHDEKWKTVRNAITPIFTTGKIKQLNTITQSVAEEYAQKLMVQCEKSNGRYEKMQFKEFLAPLILEVLAKSFCGIEIPNATDPNNEFIKNMKLALWHDQPKEDWKTLIYKMFPIIEKYQTFEMDESGMNFFVGALKNILATREKSGQESIDATSTLVEMMKKVRNDADYKRLGINENTVIAQAWEFFLAGYAGTRDTFEFLMYEMAVNPEVQESILAEIDALPHWTLEAITNNLPLLQAAITETGRKHANFIRLERKCNKDWQFEGIRIPKDTQLVFPLAALHYNPEFYPNPEKFDPWRFMGDEKKSRDAYTNLTFGQGPRNCIGQRFATETLKILLATFLKKFKIAKRQDTICNQEIGGSIILIHKPIFVDVLKR